LTGGVAHDFNNLLTITMGNLEMAARALDEGNHAKLPRLIEAARLGAVRGANLTQRLLAFSRRQPLQPQLVDMGKLVAGMTELFKRSVGESIKVETSLREKLWQAKVDPNQLESALLNLVINSRDAIWCSPGSSCFLRRMSLPVPMSWWRCAIRAWVCRRISLRGRSSRFSPPRKSAKAPGSA
jgi:C4-dicarboxylate-specific signal transduction histidine kinase